MRDRVKRTVKYTILSLCLGLVSLFATTSCDKLRNLRVDEINEVCQKNMLVGNWKEIYPRYGNLVTFSNDTMYHNFVMENVIWKSTYQFISKDSIQIARLWWLDGVAPCTTDNKIIFYSSDSILIERYYPSIAAVYPPQFHEIKLVRIFIP